jgi:hypothetical protein
MPMLTKPELFEKINAAPIETLGGTTNFAMRLGDENGWNTGFTDRVIREYKRFAYLSQVADHPVAPSDPIEQAWELHLIHTKTYWNEFCSGILEAPLHHSPKKGGKDENEKFRDRYAKTRETYRREFSEQPPEDIWPDLNVGTSDMPKYRRIDIGTTTLLPKISPVEKILFTALLGLGVFGHGWAVAMAAIIFSLIVGQSQNWGEIPDQPKERRVIAG